MRASFFFRGIARPMVGIVRTDNNKNNIIIIIMSNDGGGVFSNPTPDEEGERGHNITRK